MIAAWVLALAVTTPDAQLSSEKLETAVVSPARLALATQLTDLLLPDQMVLQTNMDAWEAGLKAVLLNNPGIANVEREFPGAIDSAVDAGRPLARPYIWSQLLKAKAIKARVTAEMLEDAELQAAIDFYSSPAGRRFIHSLSAKSDPRMMASSVVDRANDTGEVTVTEEDGRKALNGALRETLKTVSAADMVEIMKFEATPAAKKAAEAGRVADRAMLEIFNTVDPVFMESQNKAVSDALLAHVEKLQSFKK